MNALLVALALSAGPHTPPPLPARAVARLGTSRWYHGPGGICCVTLSPDGKRAASASSEDVIVWNSATGERISEYKTPHPMLNCLAFSPDGDRLAAAGISYVFVHDARTGKTIWMVKQEEWLPHQLLFSPDGKQVRTASGAEVTAWDAATGKVLRSRGEASLRGVLKGREKAAKAVPSPDGKVIAWLVGVPPADAEGDEAPTPKTLLLTDASSNKLLYRLAFKAEQLGSFAFSPDGRHFLTGLVVHDTVTGKKVSTLDAPAESSAWLSPDGRHAFVATEAKLRLHDIKTGKSARDILAGDSSPTAGMVPRINARLGGLPGYFDGPTQPFSADGKKVLLANETTLRLIDTTTGREMTPSGHRSPVTPHFSADGKTLVTFCTESRRRWGVPDGRALGKEMRHGGRDAEGYYVLADSNDGRLLIDQGEKAVRLRDTASGRILWRLDGEHPSDLAAAFSPDGRRLLLASPKKPRGFTIHDTKTGKRLGLIETQGYSQPTFSHDGKLVACAEDADAFHLHDGSTGKRSRTLRPSRPLPPPPLDGGHKPIATMSFSFSPEGERLAVSGYHVAVRRDSPNHSTLILVSLPTVIFRVSDGKELTRLYPDPENKDKARPPSHLALSPGGHLLAVADKKLVRLIEVASGQVRAVFDGHTDGVHGLTFSPDGTLLATGGNDNVALLWDVVGPASGGWDELLSADARKAGAAVAALVRSPDKGVAILKKHLRPAEPPTEKQLARLIAGLDSDEFETRDSSAAALARLGELAEPALRRALKASSDLEVRARLTRLVGMAERGPHPETLRVLRAVEALERIASPEARRLLASLTKGAPEARITLAAKDALARFARR